MHKSSSIIKTLTDAIQAHDIIHTNFNALLLLCFCTISPLSWAQLLDINQANQGGNISIETGFISHSLQEAVGESQGDINTPGSSIYLINRDPARSIRRGRQLFQRKFSLAQGLGPRVNYHSEGDVTQNRALGAGLTDSCSGCHGRPQGSAGFGGDVATRPDSRDAPHLFGLGLVEQLADEMTQTLRQMRDEAIDEARALNQPITIDLVIDHQDPDALNDNNREDSQPSTLDTWLGNNDDNTQWCGIFWRLRQDDSCTHFGKNTPKEDKLPSVTSIQFGQLTAFPDGTVDTSLVEGVNADLRIRPFFHHGQTISIREFIIGAFNDEMGLQAHDPILCAVTDPENPQHQVSPAGFVYDPSQDNFQRPPTCDASLDIDQDGVINEIDPALVDHMELYHLNYFKPGQYEVTPRAQKGLDLMESIGCTSCHVRNLVIQKDRRIADVETVYDPENGILNDLFATASTRFITEEDGDVYPRVIPEAKPFVVRNFFSDLKRYDLGPAFHERDYDGSMVKTFVTEPLWGVGSTSPYGHDGRSINLDQVIRRHGGDAQEVTDNYIALSSNERRMIQEFLQTLVLFPPDDTASNLDPGNPYTNNPQDPKEHGSVSLAPLYQILEEGTE